ncbi:SpoIIE family protein phosphatase [Luteitalea sp.]|uniref:SpoIIE family protein phosphatase n=1 Tax=Luteitalea sp. TaxID=2004800 RepID=UPI0025BD3E96|nr:SpoIIE family protein phosphatase [Luteitalea sp.]
MPPARLKLVPSSPEATTEIVPGDQPIIIGRDPLSGVVLSEPSVSRRHAQLVRREGTLVLEDLGSAVGTYVNDQRVHAHILSDGDRVRFGRQVQFEVVSETIASLLESAGMDDRSTGVRHLQELLDVARQLNSAAVLPEVLAAVLRSAIRIMRAESGALALINGDQKLELVLRLPKLAAGPVAQQELDLLRQAVKGHRTITSQAMHETLIGAATGTRPDMVATPLMVARRALADDSSFIGRLDAVGALLVARTASTQVVPREEIAIFESLAADAAMAIDSARLYKEARAKAKYEHEMTLAKDIQAALLQAPPEVSFATTFATTESAASVGGDLYQGVTRPDGSLALTLGDVSGKGVGASLIMALATGMLRLLHDLGQPLSQILPTLHTQLLNYSPGNKYLTLGATVLYPDGRLELANAGHCAPVLVRRSGEVTTLEAGGPVLGLLPFGSWEVETLQLEPGDALVIYSDGVSESTAHTGEDFGPNGVATTLATVAGRTPSEMASTLLDASVRFRDGRPAGDDVSLLVVRYEGQQGATRP